MGNKYLRFEELEVWQDAMKLCKKIYFVLKDCKDYGLKDQMQRASVSIPSNIAEGYERKGSKETVQFLYIAKGSCGELRTQLYIATDLGYIEQQNCKQLIEETINLSIKIYRYIQSIQ
ncbi:MAG: four helix bundle protein [Lentimicrobiaceae bacterium]|nr:four helix bundle protein [Lentimicrobiaceae bacterium]